MKIPQVQISPYNKHANGVVECGHFILREAIVKSYEKDTNGHIKNWHKQVELAAFADCVTVSSVTGYSPYYLLHGTHPILPFDLSEATFMVDGFKPDMTTSDLLALRIQQLQKHPEDVDRAAKALKKARFTSKEQFEKWYKRQLCRTHYKAGELVLVRNSAIKASVSSRTKTEDRYLGPYIVIQKTKGGAYVLREPDEAQHTALYAAFRLLPYISCNSPLLEDLIGDQEHSDSEESDDADHLPDPSDESSVEQDT
jgi:hypothetical protein